VTIRWTRLHAALGESPADLTLEHIQRAIEQRVVEFDDLDWKRAIPTKEGADEFAKDIAAMANSRGGLIVYGVAEETGTGAAQAIVSVAASEGELRRLRATALTGIHPGVPIELVPLSSASGDQTVLAVSVPASQEAPHVVRNGEQWLGAPYRSGPDTHWMREPQLARAYAQRLASSRSRIASLAEDFDEVTELLDLDKGSWIVGVAHRQQPLPGVLPELNRDQVKALMQRALDLGNTWFEANTQSQRLLQSLGDAALNPRIGLRRWVMQSMREHAPDNKAEAVLVEIRHDGSVAFACSTEGWYPPVVEAKHQVPASLVAGYASDLVALVGAVTEQAGDATSLAYRVDLARPSADRPFAGIDVERFGGMVFNSLHQPPGSRTVRRFAPVLGELAGVPDLETRRREARQIAADVLNQFGMDYPSA
jgi:hypothetical protein